ncbi:MmyB family transcriptional regulator [Streptomyces lasiicapitis]|uniref:MmyB family transcriptional regulator n=1 Tax=Streptomyces lasiicapitis TaxID=1923961 RepID=UPI0036A9BC72
MTAAPHVGQDSPRRELGGFLRAHRALLAPADVGLPATPRRRIAGLRREEVAALSGVSVAWYTWLEQGRVDTSRQVLDAVARTLRMDEAAHAHALTLAGFAPSRTATRTATPSPHPLQPMLDAWPTSPALLLTSAFDILAWNKAYATLWPDPADVPPDRRNLLLLLTTDPGHQSTLPTWQPLALALYRHFRTRADREPPTSRSARVTELLRDECPDLAAWWGCRSVGDFTSHDIELTTPAGELAPYEATLLLTSEPRDGCILVQTPARSRLHPSPRPPSL